MKKLLILGLLAISLVACDESDPLAGNPTPNQNQATAAKCTNKGEVWVYDHNGLTCASPNPPLSR